MSKRKVHCACKKRWRELRMFGSEIKTAVSHWANRIRFFFGTEILSKWTNAVIFLFCIHFRFYMKSIGDKPKFMRRLTSSNFFSIWRTNLRGKINIALSKALSYKTKKKNIHIDPIKWNFKSGLAREAFGVAWSWLIIFD